MKASETNILTFLDGKKQFVIPIYQRTYSWTLTQCQRLWDDISQACSSEVQGHFLGSVVYIAEGIIKASTVPQFVVIDGQQRLTTISLLLLALRKRIGEQGDENISVDQINADCIVNVFQKDDLRYKLMLTRSDKDTYIKLVENEEIDQSKSSKRILENYRYFVEQIAKSDIDPYKIYMTIGKLLIVDISLDRNYDNPQLIFESLNSTGLDLSQSDLIRNYLLMGLEPDEQNPIYIKYWYPMEQRFKNDKNPQILDRFIRDFLTMKIGRIPNVSEVYNEFKLYCIKYQSLGMYHIIEEIYRFSKYYAAIIFRNTNDKELNRILEDIVSLQMEVSYPFILGVYGDFNNGTITRDEFIEILKLIESYVFRRAICGIPTNSLNKTFATMAGDVDHQNYLTSIKALLFIKESYRRFPNDEEFKNELVLKDIYSLRICSYIFRKFENEGNKAPINMENYTIEHIMPQNENLSAAWKQELGPDWEEIHSKYLHTLGNLTLTAYNSEMSDKPFVEKRDMKDGFKQSALKLNADVVTEDNWGEKQIIQRAVRLANVAQKIWPSPALPKEIVDLYRNAKVKKVYNDEDVYEMKYKNAEAKMIVRQGKYALLKGSTAVKMEAPAARDDLRNRRIQLINDGFLIEQNGYFLVNEDIEFSSSSGAASVVAGLGVNGNINWILVEEEAIIGNVDGGIG